MKIQAAKVGADEFIPIKVTLLLETARELAAFYSIFNHSGLANLLTEQGLQTGTIHNELSYVKQDAPTMEAHKRLCNFIDGERK